MRTVAPRIEGQFDTWTNVGTALPPVQGRKARRRYMVYAPVYGGYVFRCWSSEMGFGNDGSQNMISGVTHWRIARRGEEERQLATEELQQFKA